MKSSLVPPFVYLVPFVVKLFLANYGGAKNSFPVPSTSFAS